MTSGKELFHSIVVTVSVNHIWGQILEYLYLVVFKYIIKVFVVF